MGKCLTVAIAGLGSRGKDVYAQAQKKFPGKMKIVAVADIDPEKVEIAAKEFDVPKEGCFKSAEEMLEQDKLADVMFIATQDRQHVGHAIPALRKGYHLLLEKPISPLLAECRELVKVAKECDRRVVVCHVLRYTPIYQKVKELLDAGEIGAIVSIMASENVGWWHMAHSFVRGNWCNSNETSPMILQKCCHDMDLYLWLAGKTCDSISSYGDTYLFKEEKAPEGCAMRCLDCKIKGCPFNAEDIYLNSEVTGVKGGNKNWPANVAIWGSVGYNMIILLAGMQGISKSYYEAAAIDGAGPVQRFFKITVPLLTPTIFFVTITGLIGAFQVFDSIYMMIDPQTNPAFNQVKTMNVLFYQNAFMYGYKGYAAAISIFMFVIIMIITAIQLWGQKKWVNYD